MQDRKARYQSFMPTRLLMNRHPPVLRPTGSVTLMTAVDEPVLFAYYRRVHEIVHSDSIAAPTPTATVASVAAGESPLLLGILHGPHLAEHLLAWTGIGDANFRRRWADREGSC